MTDVPGSSLIVSLDASPQRKTLFQTMFSLLICYLMLELCPMSTQQNFLLHNKKINSVSEKQ